MSTLTDSPEYKALTDSLDRLAERGLFCALVALFRSLFALLSAIKSGAILLPPPPVIEPRLDAKHRSQDAARPDSVRADPKGVDGRDKHDHDAHGEGRRVRRPAEPAAAVAKPVAEATDDLPSQIKPQIRRRAVRARATARVREADARVCFSGLFAGLPASHGTSMALWLTADDRCFRNGPEASTTTRAHSVTITYRSGIRF